MKNRKRTPLALELGTCLLALLLTACGGGSFYSMRDTDNMRATSSPAASGELAAVQEPGAMPTEEYMEYDEDTSQIALSLEEGATVAPTQGAGAAVTREDYQQSAQPPEKVGESTLRKIIRNSSLTLETKEFDQAVEELTRLVGGVGGYISSQNVKGNSLYDGGKYNSRYASITARVPAEQLDGVIASVGGLCNMTNKSEDAQDISEQYYDAQAHLKSLNLQEERLLEILSKAEKLEDVVSLEQALGEVRYQIETLTASLRRMDSQVAYSTLTMELTEVMEYKVTADTPPRSFGDQIASTAAYSMTDLVGRTQNFVLYLVANWLNMVIGLVILVVVLLVARKVMKVSGVQRSKLLKEMAAANGESKSIDPPENPENH